MNNDNDYPQPHADADNQPMLDAWRNGQLLLQRCGGCDAVIFYPRPLCPECWSQQLSFHEATGRGRIVAFSLVHRPNHPSFNEETPIVLAEIELHEGPSMISRVVGCDADAVRSGMTVSLVTGEDCARYPLPTFTLDLD
jgi:uncharacterized OB-fold protein